MIQFYYLNKNRLQLKKLTYREGEQKLKIDLGTNRNSAPFYDEEERTAGGQVSESPEEIISSNTFRNAISWTESTFSSLFFSPLSSGYLCGKACSFRCFIIRFLSNYFADGSRRGSLRFRDKDHIDMNSEHSDLSAAHRSVKNDNHHTNDKNSQHNDSNNNENNKTQSSSTTVNNVSAVVTVSSSLTGPNVHEESTRWTNTEKELFKQEFLKNPRNWKAIADVIKTKTPAQVKNFYHNHKKKLGLEMYSHHRRHHRRHREKDQKDQQKENNEANVDADYDDRNEKSERPKGTYPIQSDPIQFVVIRLLLLYLDCSNFFSLSVSSFSGRGRPKSSTKEKVTAPPLEDSQSNPSQLQVPVSHSQTISQELSVVAPSANTVSSSVDSRQTPTVTVHPTTSSSGKVPSGPIRTASCYWTESEKKLFLHHLQINGKDWNYLSEQIPTKTVAQIKNYYQNYRVKLGLEKLLPENSLQKSRRGRR